MTPRASELLRGLEPRTITLEGQWEMRRALPELIAVVEAAEHTLETDARRSGGLYLALAEQREALDALRTRLSGGEG